MLVESYSVVKQFSEATGRVGHTQPCFHNSGLVRGQMPSLLEPTPLGSPCALPCMAVANWSVTEMGPLRSWVPQPFQSQCEIPVSLSCYRRKSKLTSHLDTCLLCLSEPKWLPFDAHCNLSLNRKNLLNEILS